MTEFGQNEVSDITTPPFQALVIIGSRTGKILYLSVRNKFCFKCQINYKNKTNVLHICYRNHSGLSTAAEAEIIVEGFKFYENHDLKFLEVIGDDDSNVIKKN